MADVVQANLAARARVERHLNGIARVFEPGTEVALIVRYPAGKGQLVLSSMSLDELATAVRRAKAEKKW